MLRAKSLFAAGLMALALTTATLSTPTEAEAHPALLVGLAAGAIGILVGATIASAASSHVVVEHAGANCVVKQRVGAWGRVRQVEVCR